ncbi:hypothetical protein [Granulicella arctica]|uniref:hypothetical protein n=1 Tax=Granulicella arctica TaxID=940613 RepID=UPI0021E05775|nr:hypothetical protein [Granulicella arctica]
MSPSRICAALLCALATSSPLWSQDEDVSLHVTIAHDHDRTRHQPSTSRNIVVWLNPVQPQPQPLEPRPAQQYTLVQKDKQFTPHVLVVPTGSSVDFPNMDPFFHNVFSLFNGKRFDLGLYEAHTHHTVHFDREGISYIFCNIHPQMGAVILSLSTPYYGTSLADGSILIHDVPPGSYQLTLWAEDVTRERLAAAARVVEIKPGHEQLATIVLQGSGDMMAQHTNKFGEPYQQPTKDPY